MNFYFVIFIFLIRNFNINNNSAELCIINKNSQTFEYYYNTIFFQ